jgi:hypothetical protein
MVGLALSLLGAAQRKQMKSMIRGHEPAHANDIRTNAPENNCFLLPHPT